jgi:polyhydroxyalkanoate synthesis regulator phasin
MSILDVPDRAWRPVEQSFTTMIDTFKKTLLAGLGAAVVTKDKVQAGLDDFVKQGKVTAADAKAMAEKIAEQSRVEFDAASSKLGEKVRDFVNSVDHTFHARIEALEKRVDALEAKEPARKRKS